MNNLVTDHFILCFIGSVSDLTEVCVSFQIIIYDGKTGEKIGTVGGEKAHEGGIYAVRTLVILCRHRNPLSILIKILSLCLSLVSYLYMSRGLFLFLCCVLCLRVECSNREHRYAEL